MRTDISGQRLMVNLSQDEVKEAPELVDNWRSEAEQELAEAKNYFSRKTTEFKDWLTHEAESDGRAVQRDTQAGERQAFTEEQQRWSRRITNLIGLDVRNERGEVIGELYDLVLDTDKGKVTFALIDIQDIEDMKDQTAVCPWGSGEVLADEKAEEDERE